MEGDLMKVEAAGNGRGMRARRTAAREVVIAWGVGLGQ
jgi:hypothetical protein